MFKARSLLILLVLFAAGGAQCMRPMRTYGPPAPEILPEAPTLGQVIDTINHQTARVGTYSTSSARLSVVGLPSIPANLAVQPPRSFRLRAETAITGPELDFGSNDELFWFWVKRNSPPALYFCRHEKYHDSAARQVLPIQPLMLIDAIGLVQFDPNAHHTGPHFGRNDRLEIRSYLPPEQGSLVKVTVLDARKGFIIEQHIYSAEGTHVASVFSREHRYFPQHDIALPQVVELKLPSRQFSLRLDIDDIQINQLAGDPEQLWKRPVYPGHGEVDLGTLAPAEAAQHTPLSYEQPQMATQPQPTRPALLPRNRNAFGGRLR